MRKRDELRRCRENQPLGLVLFDCDVRSFDGLVESTKHSHQQSNMCASRSVGPLTELLCPFQPIDRFFSELHELCGRFDLMGVGIPTGLEAPLSLVCVQQSIREKCPDHQSCSRQ